MDSTQATFLAEQLTALWESEFKATCAVLSAVPDSGREYRPDAKSRTAWALATHIAVSDVWFLNSVLGGAFVWDVEKTKALEGSFTNVDAVAAWYKETFPAKLAEVRAMSGDQLSSEVDFFGAWKAPAVNYVGIGNNHSVHHRGQLASYLRAMGSKVPPIYGDSADFPSGT